MRILFCGDVVGRSGRDVVLQQVPVLREELKLDCVIVSTDNAAHGFGVSTDICKDFLNGAADVLTGGDHVWDQRDIHEYIGKEPRLLRPHNFPDGVPGSGAYVFTTKRGKKILVAHVLGQVFHKENLDCPFAAMDKLLKRYTLGGTVDAIFVDVHAEATSEKMAMGRYLDGRVSAVVGSHTHIPTADSKILKGGTAYQTDAGMCGDYDSVIGFQEDAPLSAFVHKMRRIRMQPADGEGTLCATYIDIDDQTGFAREIRHIMRGGIYGNS
jgi:2',3'-cyclic-nucleotide 2'-phosphodiesterase